MQLHLFHHTLNQIERLLNSKDKAKHEKAAFLAANKGRDIEKEETDEEEVFLELLETTDQYISAMNDIYYCVRYDNKIGDARRAVKEAKKRVKGIVIAAEKLSKLCRVEERETR